MPVNTYTQTKYFSNNGPGADALAFSTIASTLGRPGTNIRFGDYRRKTGANEVFADVNGTVDEKAAATAIVPDSYENQNCGVSGGGISASTNHKVSSLKNMIKRYDLTHTGTSASQLNVSGGGGVISDNWATNLDLNIPKRLTFDGSTLRASTTGEHAVAFSDSALNLELRFNGTQVLGKEGTGGSGQTVNSAATSGGSGGGALYLRNTTSKTTGNASTINLNLSNTALIAGGGGGGGGGAVGNVSGTTICSNYYSYQITFSSDWYAGCPGSCAGGETQNYCSYTNNSSVSYFRGQRAQGTWYWTPWYLGCSGGTDTNIGAATPAAGGGGGTGQGSNNTGGAVGGNSPGSAASLNCGGGYSAQNQTSNTTAGFNGGAGGAFGAAGGGTNVANGGSPGPWLNVSNTRWANKGASGALVQRSNIA